MNGGWTRIRGWVTAGLVVGLGAVGVVRFSEGERAQAPRAGAAATGLFLTADQCSACHNGIVTPEGEDISFEGDWRSGMMANAARDPYWQAAVRREIVDHPQAREAIENECSTCHMPMAHVVANVEGLPAAVFAHVVPGGGAVAGLAMDGVSCTTCHQIEADNLGTEESFTGGFVIDAQRSEGRIFGPYDVDDGRAAVMHSVTRFMPEQGLHIQRSEMCATCHTLYTHALGPGGAVVGELPEQVPFLEWKHSSYRDEQSCQSCHMAVVTDSTAITSVLAQPREGVSRHEFRGGNFFMLRILNRYRDELGVVALPPELDAAVMRTVAHLQDRSARVSIENPRLAGSRLTATVVLENLAGHKLPTAYPSRRAWIHLIVRAANGSVVFESGALRADGSIAGNDNDADPSTYEPHYAEVTRSDQVQIYEAILADDGGRVTTGLLTATQYVKDNRILPDGFDKATAENDIAVFGGAREDADFAGGRDRVEYVVDVGRAQGPFSVEATLWYQPIGFRWARNLDPYDTFETNRFVAYYDAMAGVSAIPLAGARASAGDRAEHRGE